MYKTVKYNVSKFIEVYPQLIEDMEDDIKNNIKYDSNGVSSDIIVKNNKYDINDILSIVKHYKGNNIYLFNPDLDILFVNLILRHHPVNNDLLIDLYKYYINQYDKCDVSKVQQIYLQYIIYAISVHNHQLIENINNIKSFNVGEEFIPTIFDALIYMDKPLKNSKDKNDYVKTLDLIYNKYKKTKYFIDQFNNYQNICNIAIKYDNVDLLERVINTFNIAMPNHIDRYIDSAIDNDYVNCSIDIIKYLVTKYDYILSVDRFNKIIDRSVFYYSDKTSYEILDFKEFINSYKHKIDIDCLLYLLTKYNYYKCQYYISDAIIDNNFGMDVSPYTPQYVYDFVTSNMKAYDKRQINAAFRKNNIFEIELYLARKLKIPFYKRTFYTKSLYFYMTLGVVVGIITGLITSSVYVLKLV